ncbi:hypothetical protein FE257_010936 [Aspergillus nanangensis]|uniref:Uncharacterized protein n=1 Tax=Aspergillus nanangensis TaxID=2582783 RepID=A0AAD4GXA7_ASPNN|nr:hypothetical protein FE257_010936 [Aspergillus nanangensis]
MIMRSFSYHQTADQEQVENGKNTILPRCSDQDPSRAHSEDILLHAAKAPGMSIIGKFMFTYKKANSLALAVCLTIQPFDQFQYQMRSDDMYNIRIQPAYNTRPMNGKLLNGRVVTKKRFSSHVSFALWSVI